jgi:signal transduction histidine kinase
MKAARSIRTRMTVGFVAIMATAVACVSLGIVLVSNQMSEVGNSRFINRIAQRSAERTDQPDWRARLISNARERPLRDRNIGFVLVDNNGKIVWQSRAGLPNPSGLQPSHWYIGRAPAAGGMLYALQSRANSHSLSEDLIPPLIALSAFTILAVAVGSWFLVGRTLQPIGQLAAQADEASAEKLYLRLEAPSEDKEVVHLVHTLNGMLTRVSDTVASKGRFYAAASHELRTPLQALGGHLETAISKQRTADEYEEFLHEAYAQSDRLSSLVQDLLLLHQLESASPEHSETADLEAICNSVLESLQPLIEAKELCLAANIAQVTVHGRESHAQILVRNLLENATQYSTPECPIRVTLSPTKTGAKLEVFNHALTPPDWDSPQMQEPFYRADASRSSRTGGNGLGLAICRRIATANDWVMQLTNVDGGVLATVLFR